MSNHHVAVWLDHSEARIFHVTASAFTDPVVHSVVTSPSAHMQLHRRSGSDDGHRMAENHPYYQAVTEALADADAVLVLGPSTAKLELIKHAHRHAPKLAANIVGVETVDHPTDRQIAALARRYFVEADALLGT
jgi:stalled ribosome rescue protein Dom34